MLVTRVNPKVGSLPMSSCIFDELFAYGAICTQFLDVCGFCLQCIVECQQAEVHDWGLIGSYQILEPPTWQTRVYIDKIDKLVPTVYLLNS